MAFCGDDIVQLPKEENCSVLFTVRAWATDDALLDRAGCEDGESTWGSELVAHVEVIIQAAGLRG